MHRFVAIAFFLYAFRGASCTVPSVYLYCLGRKHSWRNQCSQRQYSLVCLSLECCKGSHNWGWISAGGRHIIPEVGSFNLPEGRGWRGASGPFDSLVWDLSLCEQWLYWVFESGCIGHWVIWVNLDERKWKWGNVRFLDIFWWAIMCWPLLCLCRPFCIFERCLDSNPESCRSKQVRYELSHAPISLF
jgi:hypothetical protein